MIIEISVAIAVLAFVVLVIYLIGLMKSLQVTLGQVNMILSEGRQKIDGLNKEVKKLLEETNHITTDVRSKVDALNPIFKTVSNLGEIVESKTNTLKHNITTEHLASFVSSHPMTEEKHAQIKGNQVVEDSVTIMADLIELTSRGARLWQNLKKRR